MGAGVHENRAIEGVGIERHAFDNVYTLPQYYVKSRAADTAKPMIRMYAGVVAGVLALQVLLWCARICGASTGVTPVWFIFDNPLQGLAHVGDLVRWAVTAGYLGLLPFLACLTVFVTVLVQGSRAGKRFIETTLGFGKANAHDIRGSGYVWSSYNDLKQYVDYPGPPCGEITDPSGKTLYIWGKEDEHRLVIAPTGAGKTTRYVFYRIFTINHSFIMLDVKGEGWTKTAGDLQARGFEVVRISMSDDHPQNGGINLLHLIPHGIYESRYAQDLAEGVTGGDATNTKASIAEGYFANNAAALITAMILYVIYTCPPEKQTFRYINHLLTPGKSSTYKKMLEQYATTPHDPQFAHNLRDAEGRLTNIHPDIYTPLMQIASAPEQTLQSIITTVQRYLRPFSNPLVARAMERTTVDVRNLHSRKVAIFVVVAFSSVKSLGGVNRTWCNFLFKLLCGDRQREPGEGTVEFIVDEADSMGNAPFLNDDLQVSRGARVFLNLIYQGRNQYLKTFQRYQMIEAGCNTQYVFTPNDDETAKWLSEQLGKLTWTYVRAYDREGEPVIATEMRSVLFPDETRRIPKTHAVIFRRGETPLYVRMRGYFDDAALNARSKIPPPFDVTQDERRRLADAQTFDAAASFATEAAATRTRLGELDEHLATLVAPTGAPE